MINTILTYDHLDNDLGSFFESCALKTKGSTNSDFNILEINSQQLNELAFQFHTESVNKQSFLFISYTHGSETGLLKNGITPFISETINTRCLKNSFAYCFACHSGKILGSTLIKNGAIAFVGYNDKVTIQKFFDAFNSFVDCATSGIIYFISGMGLNESVAKMKEKYTDCIDRFYLKDMIIASFFMENRDAIVVLGDDKILIQQFHN